MSFSFIQITDHHIAETEATLVKGFSPAYALRAVLEHIAAHHAGQVDFIVSTGDLVDRPTGVAYQTLRRVLGLEDLPTAAAPGPLSITLDGQPALPFYCLPGNHDDRDQFFRVLFPQSAPTRLVNAAFIHKGINFICLDLGPGVKAELHAETLDFLVRALVTGLPAILLLHHPVAPMGIRWLDEFLVDDAEPFWQVVAGRPVLGIFCGHVHIRHESAARGIPIYSLRSTALPFAPQDEPLVCLLPPQYRLVTVENGKVRTQVVEVPL